MASSTLFCCLSAAIETLCLLVVVSFSCNSLISLQNSRKCNIYLIYFLSSCISLYLHQSYVLYNCKVSLFLQNSWQTAVAWKGGKRVWDFLLALLPALLQPHFSSMGYVHMCVLPLLSHCTCCEPGKEDSLERCLSFPCLIYYCIGEFKGMV